MGILGITPFLLRHSPHVVRRHKNRLQCFAGKTVVLDGTLLTFRFHFAPISHSHGHVYGWYRLLTELRNCGVKAICVFDGAHRSVAKSNEIVKRRLTREMNAGRAAIELARQRRLATLTSSLQKFMALPSRDRTVVGESFRRAQELSALSERRLPDQGEIPGQAVTYGHPDEFDDTPFHKEIEPLWQTLLESEERGALETGPTDTRVSNSSGVEIGHFKSTSLTEELLDLQHAFNASSYITKSILPGSVDQFQAPEEIKESKNQLLLTQDEAQIWDEIYTAFAHPDEARTSMALAELSLRSEALSEAYNKRSKPPPPECYSESKLLIEAMGVPCIESSAPYEAEGLASSLVRHGRAHFVASEDTDVLVYGAPLLRNITSRNDPLTSINPSEVRASLKLSRAAFLDFCLLQGTDFTSRLRNVGPVRALSMIDQYSRIERILKNESRYRPKDTRKYLEEVREARRIFTRIAPIPKRERLEMKDMDEGKVSGLLHRFGLSQLISTKDWRLEASPSENYFGEYSSYGGNNGDTYPYRLY